MTFSRREFFLVWMSQRKPAQAITVEVLEIFRDQMGPSALLVHHASMESRQDFSKWLHEFDGASIRLRTSAGASAGGRIFRAKMCFGRGLVLMPAAVSVSVKEKIQIEFG
jgi:hypothetical protein